LLVKPALVAQHIALLVLTGKHVKLATLGMRYLPIIFVETVHRQPFLMAKLAPIVHLTVLCVQILRHVKHANLGMHLSMISVRLVQEELTLITNLAPSVQCIALLVWTPPRVKIALKVMA